MIALILAALVGLAVPPRPVPVNPPAAVARAQPNAQERAVVLKRRMKRMAKNRANAIAEEKMAVQLAKEEAEERKALAAQREYEIRMGPIWAAQQANAIQQQRNGLIAQRNAIEQQKVVGVNPVSHLCGAFTGNPTGIYCTNRVSGSVGYCDLHR